MKTNTNDVTDKNNRVGVEVLGVHYHKYHNSSYRKHYPSENVLPDLSLLPIFYIRINFQRFCLYIYIYIHYNLLLPVRYQIQERRTGNLLLSHVSSTTRYTKNSHYASCYSFLTGSCPLLIFLGLIIRTLLLVLFFFPNPDIVEKAIFIEYN